VDCCCSISIRSVLGLLRLSAFLRRRWSSNGDDALLRYLWNVLRAAPALGYSALLVVFGISEYFRSWVNFYADRDMSFWGFVSNRLLGYYVTALNNGALLAQRIDPTGAPFFTMHVCKIQPYPRL